MDLARHRPRKRWLGPIALLASAVLLPTTPASAAPAAGGAPARATAATGVHFVTLVTGDRIGVRTDPNGKQHVVTEPAEGRGSFRSITLNGDLYVIPSAALPYLGVSLDRSLFDVSALLRDGAAMRIPVRAVGSASVPGMTVTGTPNATTRDGYLTPAGAREFGAALTAQARHDIRAGLPANRALFGGVSAIRYAGRGPAPVVTPNFPMFTERITGTGPDGLPLDFAFLTVVNVDDGRKFAGFPLLGKGEARISVPAGHYALEADTTLVDDNDNFISYVVFGEFEVTGAGATTFDMRAATAKASWQVAKPVTTLSTGFDWLRSDATGAAAMSFGFLSNDPPFVSPVPAPAVGSQLYVNTADFTSPEGSATNYGYKLHSASTGDIPADQHYVIKQRDLATVHETFAADQPGTGGIAEFLDEPWSGDFGFIIQLPFPGTHTEYVTARPGALHTAFVFASTNSGASPFGSVLSSSLRSYRPGQQVTSDWWRGPIAPGFPADLSGGQIPLFCNACRSGDTLGIFVMPETDASPDHLGFLDSPDFDGPGITSQSRFQLLSGSTVLADEEGRIGGDFAVPAGDAPYKIVYDQTRIAPWFTTAPVSHTEWTFRSARQGTRTVPANVLCDTDEPCGALPLVDLDLHLNGTSRNTMSPGLASMDLTVRHAPYAAGSPIARTSVSLSFDGGAHFVRAVVIPLGHDHFRALWLNPRHAGPVTLRVGAADRAGSTVDQTIQGAYTIAGGSGA